MNIVATAAIAIATQGTVLPPPPRSLPGSSYRHIPAEQARREAQQRGPGTCKDLERIQGLPVPGEFGWDPYVDRIMVHFPAYRACLARATSDRRPAHVAGVPGLLPRTVGDVAHVLLVYGGALSWQDCFPPKVLASRGVTYETSVYAWLANPLHRRTWHACVVKKAAPNNSSKPTPLRGAA